MFKGMELQSMHAIEIIKNGYTPTERPEPTVSSSGTNQVVRSGLDSLGQFGLVQMRKMLGDWLQIHTS